MMFNTMAFFIKNFGNMDKQGVRINVYNSFQGLL